jgi:hypothetical protein
VNCQSWHIVHILVWQMWQIEEVHTWNTTVKCSQRWSFRTTLYFLWHSSDANHQWLIRNWPFMNPKCPQLWSFGTTLYFLWYSSDVNHHVKKLIFYESKISTALEFWNNFVFSVIFFRR